MDEVAEKLKALIAKQKRLLELKDIPKKLTSTKQSKSFPSVKTPPSK